MSTAVYYPTFFNLPQPVMAAYYAVIVKATGVVPSYTGFQHLVFCVAAENVAKGITSSGKTKLVAETLQQVMYYGTSGSLWEAYNALNQVQVTPEMAPFITKERIDWMKNQLVQTISSL